MLNIFEIFVYFVPPQAGHACTYIRPKPDDPKIKTRGPKYITMGPNISLVNELHVKYR